MPSPYWDVTQKIRKAFEKQSETEKARRQKYTLEQINAKGGVEKDINLALQSLRNKGALKEQALSNTGSLDLQGARTSGELALERAKESFAAPLQEAQIQNINAAAKQQRFDTRLGMDYSGSFLEGKRATDKLYRQYLENQFNPQSPTEPNYVEDTSREVSPLPRLPEKVNLLRYYHPFMVVRGVKQVGLGAKKISNYLKRHFTLGTSGVLD